MKRIASLLLVLSVLVTACGGGSGTQKRTLTVLAASSLTGTFTDLATRFEAEHPGVHVRLVFDSSATLAQMTIDRAPGDVLATADRRTMDSAAAGKGVRGTPGQFATNVLVLAVPSGNPKQIGTFTDLDRSGIDYLTCVPTAPCGAAAKTLLQQAGIRRAPVSEEVDVKAVLAKVAAGEADAGLVYRSDVTASKGQVTAIDVPGASASPNTYWVAVTANAKQRTLAQAWVGLLTGATGRAVLQSAGFGTG